MIIGERLKGYLKHAGITAREFAAMVGVTEGMIYKYYKMESVDTAMLCKWGEVLNVPFMTFIDDNQYNESISSRCNNIACGYRQDEGIDMPIANFNKGVPYYNVDFLGGFDLVANDQTLTPEYLIDFPQYNEATCWCNVTGHSMEPEIAHGDIIALKLIEDFSFFPMGEIYAVVTTNDMRTIKRIGPSQSTNCYSLIPTNKSPEYGVQDLPKDKIRFLYQVLGCMKRF